MLPTEPIGSVPRPAKLLEAMAAHEAGELDGEGLAAELQVVSLRQHPTALPGRLRMTHDIFEGTEQIQQLVISRAISGLRIE